jgi:signal transduction histidine kinase/ActR/RegA family two-component response regulator
VTSLPRTTTLTRRYAWQVAGVAALLMTCAALIEGIFGYRQAREQMASRQVVLARAAATEIETYLDNIVAGLRQVQSLPWGDADFGPARRREELHRLLTLHPPLLDLQDVDDRSRERLFVSRTELDRFGAAVVPSAPPAPPTPGFATPRFDDQGVPNVTLTLPLRGLGAATRATINLRFLAEVVSGLRTEDGSRIYVVDADGLLIAHPDPTLVLKQMTVATHAPVAAARQASSASAPTPTATDAPGLTGEAAVTTALPLGRTGWLLLVEQSRDRALAPALATLTRMFWLALGGGAVALLVGWLLARRMAAPIARLREATARLAAGQWDTAPKVDTGDEIELLARDFETMSRQLQDSYRELEAKVEARTLELRQRRDEAERANAAKTRFLAAASHDLRQPMHAIGLLIGVLRTRLAEPGTQALAEKAQQAVHTMEGLFGALLDISKLDAGAVTVRPEIVRLADTLERAQHTYAPLAAAKGLRFRVRASPHPSVHTDAALLDRIVGNLCANAIRYTEHGGVLLACRVRAGRPVLRVYDSGIGIAPEHAEAIFEEFVRLNPKTAGDEGLGLGLSIVRRSADLLGLQVTLASNPGRGSRFDVWSPAAAVSAVPSTQVVARAADAPRLQGLFVLAVDDEPDSLQATALLLDQAGCLVATASDAATALAEAARHLRPPDILLTDLRFGGPRTVDGRPADSGLQLIDRLRAQTGEAIPAVILTADTDSSADGRWGVTVLHKPAGADAVLAALAAALRREDGAVLTPSPPA